MKSMLAGLATLAFGVGMLGVSEAAGAQDNMSHRHMGHVMDGWRDTPEGKGLLPTAQAEATVAVTHAGLAMQQPDNLSSIQRHVGHVLHAIDPSAAEGGPGKGYGLIKAAEGAAMHVRLASESTDASDNVKLHATHARTAAENAVTWAKRIQELGAQVQAATAAARAAELCQEIHMLAQAIANGQDANNDGRIGWQQGEGGLEQAAFHMGLMKRGEGTQ